MQFNGNRFFLQETIEFPDFLTKMAALPENLIDRDYKNSYHLDNYINEDIDYEEFLVEYHDINNYNIEDPHENRSHQHE